MKRKILWRIGEIVFAIGLMLPAALAQTSVATTAADATAQTSQPLAAEFALRARKLEAINSARLLKRDQVLELLSQLGSADEVEKEKIKQRIGTLQQAIRDLKESFEKTAVSGVNLRNFDEEVDLKLDWRDELIQIAQPILTSLKEATEKPRKVAELRSAIELYQLQLEVTRKASTDIALLDQQAMSQEVVDELTRVAATWRERGKDIELSLEASHQELQSLQGDKVDLFDTVGSVLHDFMVGRGLTLLLALGTGIFVWFAMKLLHRLVNSWRRPARNTNYAAKIRLLLYAYHLITIILVTLAVLSVFYIRGDLLLLSLAIITLAMLALGAWRFLPGYITEARLLLNAGAAREGERVIHNGLPFRIARLNLYSELHNPELEGVIRLPLSALALLTSRQGTDESWFPSSVDDYLLLPDGSFGQVLQQTVELVRLKVLGSMVQYATADFLQLHARNLSREGFGLAVVFGIDYRHQEIALNRVPERFKAGLLDAFERAGFGDDLEDLLVEFKAAATNSLDYQVYATMNGRSAASYFKITRLVQQTCVDICNREDWGIPFTQITIHQNSQGGSAN